MKKTEFVKAMSFLGVAFGKEYTTEECDVYYSFLKDYDYQVFVSAIKNQIKKSSYLPKINELIDECNNCKEEIDFKVIDFMKVSGYFKAPIEYEKTLRFVKSGIVPEWLKKDINNYRDTMNNKKIEFGGNDV
jgi:hypothetical protein